MNILKMIRDLRLSWCLDFGGTRLSESTSRAKYLECGPLLYSLRKRLYFERGKFIALLLVLMVALLPQTLGS
jgi:hypothetical protein